MTKKKALVYARTLAPNDLADSVDVLSREARARGYEVIGEYCDVGPPGFGRMSGWRRLVRSVRDGVGEVVFVRSLKDFPVPLTGLLSIAEKADIVSIEDGDLDGLSRFLSLAHEVEAHHRRERVRFSVWVARGIKAVGRPRKNGG